MRKKRVLYFMPDNPTKGKAGNITRCCQMLSYFSDRASDLEVDFVSEESWGQWDAGSQSDFRLRYPSINLHVINRKVRRDNFLKYLFHYKIPLFFRNLFFNSTIDHTTPMLRRKMRKLFSTYNYDIVVISYVHWGGLVDLIPYQTYKVIDTHDFITAQYSLSKGLNAQQIGKVLGQELEVLRKFDEIWTYSVEEKYIFEQFNKKIVKLLPVGFPPQDKQIAPSNTTFDILYIASDNPHNKRGATWFYENVLPLLNQHIRIGIVGNIGKYIPEHDQLSKIGVIGELHDVYHSARVVICPMLSGTGVKVKVLEGISFGKPVVTTVRGVDGLLNKRNNGCIVCNNHVEFAAAIHNLLDNPDFYREIVQQGKEYLSTYHSQKKEVQILDEVFLKNCE